VLHKFSDFKVAPPGGRTGKRRTTTKEKKKFRLDHTTAKAAEFAALAVLFSIKTVN